MGREAIETMPRQPIKHPWPGPMRGDRHFLAFCIAAITPGLLVGTGFSVWSAVTRDIGFLATLYLYPFLAALRGLFTTLPAILFVAIPTYFLYRRLGWSDWLRCVLGGAVIGWGVTLVWYGGHWLVDPRHAAFFPDWASFFPVELQLGYALCGAAAASMFWFVLNTRRGEQAFLAKAAIVSLATIALALFR